MSNPEEKLQRIVRLKSYERPPEGYFENFLEEFQSRQRGDLLQRSSLSLFLERVSTWFREAGSLKWIVGAGMAYAAFTMALLLWPGHPGTTADPSLTPASYQPGNGRPLPVVDFRAGEAVSSSDATLREF